VKETTEKNLKSAFAGESMARIEYLSMSERAGKDGMPNMSRLFKALAEAETVHANMHLRVLGTVGSTLENVQGSLKGETWEFTEMYPGFIQASEKDEEPAAGRAMGNAGKAEQGHAGLFQRVLPDVTAGSDPQLQEIFVCSVCGNTVLDTAPERCPICGAPAVRFMKF
jgi:rubrerythrin